MGTITMSHHTKDSYPEVPFNALSEMDQAEEVGDEWYDAKITPLPTPLDEHVELPAKVPDEKAERNEAKSAQGKGQHPDAVAPAPPFPTPRSRSHSIDEERMPTWIPFHMPGCQHAWHHHPHHRRENTSHSDSDSMAASGEAPPCECHLSAGDEKIKEKKHEKNQTPSMQWWPEPESIAQHEWVDRDGKPASGFGMDEALSEEEELELGEM